MTYVRNLPITKVGLKSKAFNTSNGQPHTLDMARVSSSLNDVKDFNLWSVYPGFLKGEQDPTASFNDLLTQAGKTPIRKKDKDLQGGAVDTYNDIYAPIASQMKGQTPGAMKGFFQGIAGFMQGKAGEGPAAAYMERNGIPPVFNQMVGWVNKTAPLIIPVEEFQKKKPNILANENPLDYTAVREAINPRGGIGESLMKRSGELRMPHLPMKNPRGATGNIFQWITGSSRVALGKMGAGPLRRQMGDWGINLKREFNIADRADRLGEFPSEEMDSSRVSQMKQRMRDMNAPKDVDMDEMIKAAKEEEASWLRDKKGNVVLDKYGKPKYKQTIPHKLSKARQKVQQFINQTVDELAGSYRGPIKKGVGKVLLNVFKKFSPHFMVADMIGAGIHEYRDNQEDYDYLLGVGEEPRSSVPRQWENRIPPEIEKEVTDNLMKIRNLETQMNMNQRKFVEEMQKKEMDKYTPRKNER